ncbi:MAG: hypothetical protein B6D73_14305 [gamma proteobacterium symbiont of Stewartia floridana]|nr:MAG: hypothetical protein B6D73_14305 [gamma proteobacterium symbiont of Stewartia floridana]
MSPFSNTVTKVFLYVGAGLLAAPLLEHLIIKVILLKYFEIEIPIDVPDTSAYVAGVILMINGALYNIAHSFLMNRGKKIEAEEAREKKKVEVPHDQKIIEKLLSNLPYENTRYWVERAPTAGILRDFAHGLEQCEKFITPPYRLYNEVVEKKKVELVSKISSFNQAAYGSGYLGAQEDKSGKMYLPPYHWKVPGQESEERYYDLLHKLTDAGQDFLKEYDEFILCVKSQGFIIEEI